MRVQLLCIGFILSLFVFQAGLLIKKQSIIDQKSQCVDVNSGKNCWLEPTYKRAVIILIDALRLFIFSLCIYIHFYFIGTILLVQTFKKMTCSIMDLCHELGTIYVNIKRIAVYSSFWPTHRLLQCNELPA